MTTTRASRLAAIVLLAAGLALLWFTLPHTSVLKESSPTDESRRQ